MIRAEAPASGLAARSAARSHHGNVSGDGAVTVGDAVLALRLALGPIAPTPEQALAADVNADGQVAIADATPFLRDAVGIRASE